MSSTLISSPGGKLKAQPITYDQLSLIPTPAPMGRLHKPVPHIELVDALLGEVTTRGYGVQRQSYAVGANGMALFGVIDLQAAGLAPTHGAGLSLGFRSGNDQSMRIKVVAGARVFVCDNLALSGDLVAMSERHTIGLSLIAEVRIGFDKFLGQAVQLQGQIADLQARPVSNLEAKQLIYDVFADRLVPVRLLDDVHGFYFNPGIDMTDCQPRTVWGVHNAFTRAMQQLRPIGRFQSTIAIGKRFGLSSTPDIEVVADPVDDQD